eukprot:GHVR01156352.1.p1 GENE.GHVR01156352.1~~GHVR01156352.1.p1  ORF type:complete len:224 (+),score=58.83 GHVR01156352.1:22-672(+)
MTQSLNFLKISPSPSIIFQYELFRSSTSTLKLENTSDVNVAFKIKTTAPRNYLVRPSNGVIRPGEKSDIQIILQPLSVAPESETSSDDKFLVQAAQVSDDKPAPKDFWTNVPKNMIQDQRLQVQLRRAGAEGAEGAEGGGANRGGIRGQTLQATSGSNELNDLRTQLHKLKMSQAKGFDLWHVLVLCFIFLFIGRYSHFIIILLIIYYIIYNILYN